MLCLYVLKVIDTFFCIQGVEQSQYDIEVGGRLSIRYRLFLLIPEPCESITYSKTNFKEIKKLSKVILMNQ